MPAGWVSAGVSAAGAIGGAVQSIESNNAAQSASKANAASTAQLQGAQGTMLNQAEQVAQQPFVPYTGTLTAPMSGNEQQGYSLASSTATGQQAQGDVAQGTNLVSQVGNSDWNQATAAKYMNPYTQDVTNAATAAANKTYLQNLSSLNTNTAGADAFGNGRTALEAGQLASDNQINVGTLTAKGNAAAYDSAMSAWQADNTTKLKAADAYMQAGQDVTQMNSTQISDLMKTGGVSQVIAQTDLSNQYDQFMRQQGWSANQLGPLISAYAATKGQAPTQQAVVQSNTANQLLGLGSTIAGLFGGSSSSDIAPPTVADSAPSAGLTNSIGTNVGLNNFQATPQIATAGPM